MHYSDLNILNIMTTRHLFRPAFATSSALAAAIVSTALATPLAAQPAGRPSPSLKIDSAYAGKTDLEARGAAVGEVSVSRFTADLDLPLAPLSESTTLSAGFGYSAFYLNTSGAVALPEQLESIRASLTARHRLDDRWTLLASVSPGLHNAGGKFSSDGFGVGVFALASYRFSDTFSAGAGFTYNSLSESLPVIPVVGVRWDFAPDWRFTLAFPSTRVSWSASERLSLWLSLDLDTGGFYVKNDPQPSSIGVNGRPSLDGSVVDFTSISTALGARYQLTDALGLETSLGYNFSRTADYDERNYEIESDGGAPIARLSLTYSF